MITRTTLSLIAGAVVVGIVLACVFLFPSDHPAQIGISAPAPVSPAPSPPPTAVPPAPNASTTVIPPVPPPNFNPAPVPVMPPPKPPSPRLDDTIRVPLTNPAPASLPSNGN